MNDATDRGPAEEEALHEQGLDDATTPLATPSTVQANRARMQGNGVGQRELNTQREPPIGPSEDEVSTPDSPSKG